MNYGIKIGVSKDIDLSSRFASDSEVSSIISRSLVVAVTSVVTSKFLSRESVTTGNCLSFSGSLAFSGVVKLSLGVSNLFESLLLSLDSLEISEDEDKKSQGSLLQ